ncbi:DNA-binding CsgD family transcriptional regulator/PAS domain-containing protein [Sphingobium jiangsuense]|uniref:DNA-binding CsgD family transcriptional regulator/PAS domain-containing protein n=2 Tax=Sphingobium jiangsuense TaxID=870476 RepID=A0A7W6BH65_9SPHN|nr:helix-turn-helix transcriptional regulator [Sphingobium jiangsuense]MBB3926915.1 DNA-binding CsgD family transcriptional regulator/PAS domain-containing protein [Sphingobium jiangsuense]
MDDPHTPDAPPADEAALLPLLEALYGGLTQDPPWESFLRALAEATDAPFASLLVATGSSGIASHVTPGVDPDRADEYEQLSDADPFVDLPEGQVVIFSDFVRHVPPRFREWLDKARAGQIMGVDLHAPSGASVRLRVTRDMSWPDFGDKEMALTARLVPHLRIALDLHARLTSTQAERQVFSTAMEGLAVATFILARDGRILRRNAVADRMLHEAGALRERNGRLEPGVGAAPMLDRLLRAPPPPGEEKRLEIAVPDGPPLRGVARALPPNAYGDGASLALFLADPARSGGPDPDSLRDRFQLTPAEAALAIQLAEGAALVDAARALDIAHNTARAHLRAIFAKTGTHRQVQLVHLLRTSTGGFTV